MSAPSSSSNLPNHQAHDAHDAHNAPHGGDAPSQSLRQLAISTSSPASAKPPRPSGRVSTGPSPLKLADPSPASPRTAGAVLTPLRSASVSVVPSSRSGTPTLLRKASMNSLHSASGPTPTRRASVANLVSSASSSASSRPRAGRSPRRSVSPEPVREHVIPTPWSLANAHFKAELEAHHGPLPTRRAETVVVLQDACYGHRYSRPRASRAHLSTIVERPERLKACALGVSAAYVRLGDRHQDGAFPIHPDGDAASLPSVPFRIHRSARRLSLTSPTVTNVHGARWMEELKLMCDTAEMKLAGGGKELQRPDMGRGANAEEPPQLHEGDLYLCADSLEAMEGALGGVCDAVDAVFQPEGPRRAFVAIRPPGHHCSASHPSGFCWVNNVHVGIMHAVLSHGLTHAAIVDFDLHHGDGSQAIAWQHNARGLAAARNAAGWKKTSVGYFSLHDINSYPCEMGDEEKVRNASVCIDGAHGQTVWNVHLQPWKTEADFWALYESKYAVLLDKTRAYLKGQTERLRSAGLNARAAIFVSAGFDASEHEDPGMQRHGVNVPTEFYARFTRDLVRIAAEEGTSVEGRIVSVLEGGYSDRALCSGVLSHLCGLAGDGPGGRDPGPAASGSEAGPARARKDSSASERGARRYEPAWWSAAELDALEATLAKPVPAPRVIRTGPEPNYTSPTQASQAKAVVPKARRSMSGLSLAAGLEPPRSFEPPSPPPLEVPWTIAACELTKLLIPTGRTTTSCTHEELNAEATKARRERQAAALLTAANPARSGAPLEDRPSTRMALRERKPKPLPADDGLDAKSRRKTVAGAAVLPSEDPSRGRGKQPHAPRRLSAASTVVSAESVDLADAAAQNVAARAEPGATEDGSVPAPPGSATGPAGGSLTVKKTRAPKKEAAPRAPRATKKTAAGGKEAPAASAESGAAAPPAKAGDEMDKLAGAMKKIKITVITKAQKEAREQERLEREKAAAPRPASRPASSSASVSGDTVTSVSPSTITPTPTDARLSSPAFSAASQFQPPPPPTPAALSTTAPQAADVSTPTAASLPAAVDAHRIPFLRAPRRQNPPHPATTRPSPPPTRQHPRTTSSTTNPTGRRRGTIPPGAQQAPPVAPAQRVPHAIRPLLAGLGASAAGHDNHGAVVGGVVVVVAPEVARQGGPHAVAGQTGGPAQVQQHGLHTVCGAPGRVGGEGARGDKDQGAAAGARSGSG
ncbi:hypothetical protein VTJ83DRAFT_4289 [Remersonia thermophila]|uniref:Histone deacetylase domain-containing protein n=1 Tax=Remersonia thermophila TaxID=72144 RepID=A0ABR4D9R0_9PEZI